MAKRNATSELTDRNWDHEDEPEEAGIFTQASKDILKHRQMKKAKRRNPNETASGGAFSGFSGFGAKINPPKSSPVSSNMFTTTAIPAVTYGSTAFSNTQTTSVESSKTGNKPLKGNNKADSSYYSSLKSLNRSLLSWLQKHVERDPYCILTPIFDDYQKHLVEIQKNNNNKENKDTEKDADDSDPEISINPRFRKEDSPKKDSTFGGFTKTSISGFTFPSANTSTDKSITSSGFGSSGFSFAVKQATNPTVTTAKTDEEEEYVPPKVETQEINEEGSVYTKRCKLFYQKDGNWKDRGVGNLHIKQLDDGKSQVIVRADTNLGNILLNIMLSSAIPTKRQGKNNIFIVCIPNPPIDPKDTSNTPTPMLIRVKTSEDADEMLQKLEENKH
ncbi:nuclear pore complex protein Nup50 [Patella vulgata]|uniref:nuclear pore complex protein Nup50 n=1 Tax=Patella vulgata TaxID=6465 RepID=UPI0021808696|nr:nuclear pore complex protein Nup50 [Patella vulgata]XP_050408628.1 nuclear pore complex protein Nup50 [Patella vulgata]